MRKPSTFAPALAVGVLALLLGASQAHAISEIGLRFLGGATGTGPCPPNVPCVFTNTSDIIRFAVVVDVDSLGMSAYSFELQWDVELDDQLDLEQLRSRDSLLLPIPTVPPTLLPYIPKGPENHPFGDYDRNIGRW